MSLWNCIWALSEISAKWLNFLKDSFVDIFSGSVDFSSLLCRNIIRWNENSFLLECQKWLVEATPYLRAFYYLKLCHVNPSQTWGLFSPQLDPFYGLISSYSISAILRDKLFCKNIWSIGNSLITTHENQFRSYLYYVESCFWVDTSFSIFYSYIYRNRIEHVVKYAFLDLGKLKRL